LRQVAEADLLAGRPGVVARVNHPYQLVAGIISPLGQESAGSGYGFGLLDQVAALVIDPGGRAGGIRHAGALAAPILTDGCVEGVIGVGDIGRGGFGAWAGGVNGGVILVGQAVSGHAYGIPWIAIRKTTKPFTACVQQMKG